MTARIQADFDWISGLPWRDAEGHPVPIQLAVRRPELPAAVPGGPGEEPAKKAKDAATSKDAASSDKNSAATVSPKAIDTNPFVPLAMRCRYSRPLLGRIATAGGDTLHEVAIKLARDSYLPADSKFPALTIDNPAIDAVWRRERENLGALQERGAVRRFRFGIEGERSGPVAFCREKRIFLEPIPPAAGTPLEICRDDELLHDAGLESYSGSTVRYLYQARSPEAGFWTWEQSSGRREKASIHVGRRAELYAAAAPRVLATDEDPELREHPCLRCDLRTSCYGGEGAPLPVESRLVPLTYYGSEILCVELLDLHYDELCDYLGGAPRDTVLRPSPIETAAQQRVREKLESASDGTQWLFERDREGALPLEILHLKLQAFRQLCAGVRELHARTDRPHLGLEPENVMAKLLDSPEGAPTRWGFRVQLLDLGTQLELPPGEVRSGHLPELLVPQAHAMRQFESPLVDPGEISNEVQMQLAGKAVTKRDGASFQVLEASVLRAKLPEIPPGDVVRVTPFQALPGGLTGPFHGVVQSAGAQEARIEVQLPSDAAKRGDKLPTGFDASVTFYRRYRAPCDLYALGLLLLRGVLVNDELDMISLETVTQRTLDKVSALLAAEETASLEFSLGTLRDVLRQPLLQSDQVLFRKEDREQYTRSIPDELWSDLLVFAFRLMSTHESLALASSHGLADGAAPESVMDRVLAELDEISRRVSIELFAAPARDREIGRACRGLLAEVHEALVSGEESAR